jgi:Kef-type K+ transport system membrane component KefB
MGHGSLESLLVVALLVVGAGAAGWLARRVGQPRVVGIIGWGVAVGSLQAAGVGLGSAPLLSGDNRRLVHTLAQLGLVLFMFGIGHELRTRKPPFPRPGPRSGMRRPAMPVSFAALAANLFVPLVPGVLVALPLGARLGSGRTPTWGTVVFMGLALAVTAVPVLAVIIEEQGMAEQRVARLALVLAMWNDGIIWACVTFLVAVAGGGRLPSPPTALAAAALLAAVLTLPALVGRRCTRARPDVWPAQDSGTGPGATGQVASPAVLLPLLVTAATMGAVATDSLGIHPAVGALVAGFSVPHSRRVESALTPLRTFAESMLLPVFFIDLSIGAPIQALGRLTGWSMIGAVMLCLTAIAGKLSAGLVIARLTGLRSPDGAKLGALLTCRGVTEFAFAAVGAGAGLIGGVGFAVLTLIALVATALTVPMLRFMGRRHHVDTNEAVAGGPARPAVRTAGAMVGSAAAPGLD